MDSPQSTTMTSLRHEGQVIEYVKDLMYLASYEHPPCAQTELPYAQLLESSSPSKRRSRTHASSSNKSRGPKVHPPVYLEVEDGLFYNAFFHDFGPFHIGHLYRFSVRLHDIMWDPKNQGKGIVVWCRPDARSRANAFCLLACYMVLLQDWPPHLALAPLAQAEPPVMPFRDAGYSQADYSIYIQDVVYGCWRAKEQGLCNLRSFCLEDYETFERVEMGDFNWVTPNFLAFASPQQKPLEPIPVGTPEYAALPSTTADVIASTLPSPFKIVLNHFVTNNVGLVVRLNSELYCPSYFTALGIEHLDMIFEDGTCPTMPMVRKFIRLAHRMINVSKKSIAVHCKAGLGRTGCLIGAYLIYRYGFSANEVIGYMRFMRPGMVVGPQQHWLHLNQGQFREWWFQDMMREKVEAAKPSTPAKVQRRVPSGQGSTPRKASQRRSILGDLDYNGESAGNAAVQDTMLPAPTPGQPRKYMKIAEDATAGDSRPPLPTTDVSTVQYSVHRERAGSDGDEELQVHLQARRKASSRSPRGNGEKRSVSYSATTTTTTASYKRTLYESDTENHGVAAPKTPPQSGKSGNGAGVLSVTKMRSSSRKVSEKNMKDTSGVRKNSGRVGSAGSTTAAVAKIKA